MELFCRDFYNPLSDCKLTGFEHIVDAFAFVFVVIFGLSFLVFSNPRLRLSNKLFGKLIHADYRERRIIGSLINLQHLFHIGNDISVLL